MYIHLQAHRHLPKSFVRLFAVVRASVAAALLCTCVIVLPISACSPKADLETKPRPVKVVRIADDHDGASLSYAGEIKARYETRLAFRVPGKIVSRHVDVGDQVRKG